jgi:hypothetical protein
MQDSIVEGRPRDALVEHRDLRGIIAIFKKGLKIHICAKGSALTEDVEDRLDENICAPENPAYGAKTGMQH